MGDFIRESNSCHGWKLLEISHLVFKNLLKLLKFLIVEYSY